MTNEETTFYRFLSEIRAFLSKLMHDPINGEPSQYLKDRDLTKKKLIKLLMKREILERHEKILDSTNSDKETPTYTVTYKVRKKDFETKVHRLYIKLFEENLPKKENVDESIRDCGITMGVIGGGKPGETADRWAKYINDNDNNFSPSVFKDEEAMKKAMKKDPRDKEAYETRGGIKECEGGEGGGEALGGTSTFSVGADTTRGDMGYDSPIAMISRPIYNPKGKKKKNETKPENILGKTVTAESKVRRIYVTRNQLAMLMEDGVPTTSTVGAMGDYTANGLVLKTSDGKEDPCAKAGTIKVKMVMGNKEPKKKK